MEASLHLGVRRLYRDCLVQTSIKYRNSVTHVLKHSWAGELKIVKEPIDLQIRSFRNLLVILR